MPTALTSCCKIYKSLSFLIRPRAAVSRSRRSIHCRYCNNTFQSDVSEAEYVFPRATPHCQSVHNPSGTLLYEYKTFIFTSCLSITSPFCSVCVRVSVSPLLFCLSTAFFSLLCSSFFFIVVLYHLPVLRDTFGSHLWKLDMEEDETDGGGDRGELAVCVCVLSLCNDTISRRPECVLFVCAVSLLLSVCERELRVLNYLKAESYLSELES